MATTRAPRKRWALLAYIAGDNNLSDSGLEDIQELCDVGASKQVHVGVEIDTAGEYEGSIRYEITEADWTGAAHRTVIERLPETDSGSPDTLQSFLNWGLGRYAATNYLVVVWNHGAGFRTLRRDIAYDDYGTSLDMPEIEHALRRAGIGPKKKLAIMGFDACLMNMIEIAHHFNDQVQVLVGSQEVEPGDGWPYDQVLKSMKKTASAAGLAKQIVKAYIKDYRERGVLNVTQSAIDLKKTEAAVAALRTLGNLMARHMDDHREAVQQVRVLAQTFEMADYVDLIHLARLIERHVNHAQIRQAARDVVTMAGDAILYADKLGPGVRNANGLSVWFPPDRSLYYDHRAKYLTMKCNAGGAGWVRMLDAYHS